MKKSSKSRLTPQQQELFPGSSLFDKIARAVCRAGTLPRKELHETWEMAKRVRRRYRGGRILDLACGHGLLAHIMLILDDSSKTGIAVDKEIPLNAKKLSSSLIESWPRLKNRIIYKEVSVQEIWLLVIVAVELSIKMPCWPLFEIVLPVIVAVAELWTQIPV